MKCLKKVEAAPAKSKTQQKAVDVALSAKRGEMRKANLKGASRQMVESMTEEELAGLAATDQKPLPEKKG